MFNNITKEMITSLIAAVIGIAVVYGLFNPEQAAAINTVAASVAAIVLAVAKDPK